MRHARALGMVLVAGCLGFGSAGCIQNYYPATVCGPTIGQPYGSVCDVPSNSTGTIAQPGSSKTTVIGGAPPRVVVSQPNSGFSWRRSDSDSIATTRAEGMVDEPTLQR